MLNRDTFARALGMTLEGTALEGVAAGLPDELRLSFATVRMIRRARAT